MKFTDLLKISILLFLVLLWLVFACFGENQLINATSVMLLTVQSLLLLLILIVSPPQARTIAVFFVLITFAYFPLRTMALIIEPEGLFDQFSPATVLQMNKALLYAALCFIFAGLGIYVGGEVLGDSASQETESHKKISESIFLHLPVNLMSAILIGLSILRLQAYLFLGLSRHGDLAGSLSIIEKAFYTMANADIILIMLITALGEQWMHLNSKNKFLSGVAIVSYAFARMMIGSKAAVYYPLLYWMIYKFSRNKELQFNFKHTWLIVPIAALAIVSYNVGKEIRQSWMVLRGESIELTDVFELISEGEKDDYVKLLGPLHRLSGIDPVVNVVNEKGVNVQNYVTLTNEVKSYLNQALPGTPFRVPLTAQAYGIVYAGINETYYLDLGLYTTFIWSMWGLYHALFGYFGGLLATFLTMFLLTFFFGKLAQSASRYTVFYKFTFLYGVYWILVNFGMDHLMWSVSELFGMGMLYLLILNHLPHLRHSRPDALCNVTT